MRLFCALIGDNIEVEQEASTLIGRDPSHTSVMALASKKCYISIFFMAFVLIVIIIYILT